MKGKNHFVVGVSTLLLAQGATHFIQPHTVAGVTLNVNLTLGAALAAAALGAFLPDIDLATSFIAYRTGTGHRQGCLSGTLFTWLRKLLGGHRGLTHTPWAALACAAVAGLNLGSFHLAGFTLPLTWPGLMGPWSDVGTAFTLGYASHLAADMLTKEGVKFWFPFSRAEVGLGPKFLRFRTGSWTEYGWVLAIVIAVVGQWLM